MRVFELSDQAQFLVQDLLGLGCNPDRKSFMRAGPGQVFQMALRGLARRHRLVGVLISKLIERKIDAAGKPHGFLNRLREVAEQPRHFVSRLEIAFRIGFKTPADGVDGGLLANAAQNILQGTARGMVIQHLIGRQQRHAGRRGDAIEPHQTAPVVATIQQARRKPHPIGAAALQLVQNIKRFCRVEAMRQHHGQQLAFGEFEEIIELQMAFALLGIVASFAAGQQLA